MYVGCCVCMFVPSIDVSIMTQIIKRHGEGIAANHGAGRSEEGACDLHRQIWIKKNARKKMLSEVAQL